MLHTIKFDWSRDFKAGKGTGNCFSGSDAALTSSVQIGGEILSTEKIKDWRGKIQRGQQATGTYSGTFLECSRSPGFVRSRKWCNHSLSFDWATEAVDGYLDFPTGAMAPPPAPSTSLPPTTNAQALTRFVSEARDAQGSFRGSTFVAELGDTLRQLRNPAMGIRRLIDSYHQRARRNVRKAMRRDPLNTRVRDLSPGQARAGSRALAETWLETTFGIMPLISDIRDASRALDRHKNRQPRVPVSGFAENVTVPVIEYVEALAGQNVRVRTEVHTSSTFQVRYYGAVKLNMAAFGSVAQESGFAVRDFLPALWEWIPYSFLVDYFTNIGDIVEAATFSKCNLAWVGRTWRNQATRDCSRMVVWPQNSLPFPTSGHIRIDSWAPSPIIWRRRFFSRGPYTGSLIPQFLVEVPGLSKTKKWLNIAALLRLRGMKR